MASLITAMAASITFIIAHDDMMPASRGYVRVQDSLVRSELKRENVDVKRELLETQRTINTQNRVTLSNELFNRQLQQRNAGSLDAQSQFLLNEKVNELQSALEASIMQRKEIERRLDNLK